jgi:hypothetical protein
VLNNYFNVSILAPSLFIFQNGFLTGKLNLAFSNSNPESNKNKENGQVPFRDGSYVALAKQLARTCRHAALASLDDRSACSKKFSIFSTFLNPVKFVVSKKFDSQTKAQHFSPNVLGDSILWGGIRGVAK